MTEVRVQAVRSVWLVINTVELEYVLGLHCPLEVTVSNIRCMTEFGYRYTAVCVGCTSGLPYFFFLLDMQHYVTTNESSGGKAGLATPKSFN